MAEAVDGVMGLAELGDHCWPPPAESRHPGRAYPPRINPSRSIAVSLAVAARMTARTADAPHWLAHSSARRRLRIRRFTVGKSAADIPQANTSAASAAV